MDSHTYIQKLEILISKNHDVIDYGEIMCVYQQANAEALSLPYNEASNDLLKKGYALVKSKWTPTILWNVVVESIELKQSVGKYKNDTPSIEEGSNSKINPAYNPIDLFINDLRFKFVNDLISDSFKIKFNENKKTITIYYYRLNKKDTDKEFKKWHEVERLNLTFDSYKTDRKQVAISINNHLSNRSKFKVCSGCAKLHHTDKLKDELCNKCMTPDFLENFISKDYLLSVSTHYLHSVLLPIDLSYNNIKNSSGRKFNLGIKILGNYYISPSERLKIDKQLIDDYDSNNVYLYKAKHGWKGPDRPITTWHFKKEFPGDVEENINNATEYLYALTRRSDDFRACLVCGYSFIACKCYQREDDVVY